MTQGGVDMFLGNILFLTALAFFVGAVIFGFTSKDSWRNTGITWGLLSIGIFIFLLSVI